MATINGIESRNALEKEIAAIQTALEELEQNIATQQK